MHPATAPRARALAARLRRLEALVSAGGYEVRYGRGRFRAGACLVHERRIVVMNRYSDPEARVRALEALAPTLAIAPDDLDGAARALLTELRG